MKTILHYSLAGMLIIGLSACSNKMNPGLHKELVKVPISINIRTDNSASSSELNTYLYKLKIKEFLDDFRKVNLVLVEQDENADVILDIDVKNLNILPKKEINSERVYKRTEQVGTDSNGNPVFRTTTATVYVESSEIRSTTRLSSKFTFKDSAYVVPPKNYFADYTWRYTGVSTGGDLKAFNITRSQSPLLTFEPSTNDFLFQLSNQEMLSRVSYDLRKYYQKINN